MNILTFFLIIICVALNIVAQVLLKLTMNSVNNLSFALPKILTSSMQIAINPYFITGVGCYILSMLAWLAVLAKIEISVAYPITSLGYIGTAIAGYFIFKEPVSAIRLLGIFVIIAGVYLVAKS